MNNNDETNSQNATVKVEISGFTSKPKILECSIINNKAIFEGDIFLGYIDKMKKKESSDPEPIFGIIRTGSEFRWPEGKVPYEIDPNLPNNNKEEVIAAIKHIEEKTKIRFIKRDSNNADQFRNYVRVIDDGGCYSAVGMMGEEQPLSASSGCDWPRVVHEFLHALGVWHEQSREDRENFVTIFWENIKDNMKHNFNQHILDGDDNGDYDYGSIMHYGKFDFTKIPGNPTIVAKNGQFIGQRNALSEGDIESIRSLYPELDLTA